MHGRKGRVKLKIDYQVRDSQRDTNNADQRAASGSSRRGGRNAQVPRDNPQEEVQSRPRSSPPKTMRLVEPTPSEIIPATAMSNGPPGLPAQAGHTSSRRFQVPKNFGSLITPAPLVSAPVIEAPSLILDLIAPLSKDLMQLNPKYKDVFKEYEKGFKHADFFKALHAVEINVYNQAKVLPLIKKNWAALLPILQCLTPVTEHEWDGILKDGLVYLNNKKEDEKLERLKKRVGYKVITLKQPTKKEYIKSSTVKKEVNYDALAQRMVDLETSGFPELEHAAPATLIPEAYEGGGKKKKNKKGPHLFQP